MENITLLQAIQEGKVKLTIGAKFFDEVKSNITLDGLLLEKDDRSIEFELEETNRTRISIEGTVKVDADLIHAKSDLLLIDCLGELDVTEAFISWDFDDNISHVTLFVSIKDGITKAIDLNF